ncbi:LPXTG cell wall anchor domain-containing protein [Aureliella helgolandensis]|uniref:Protein BatD n=1 Tax=Aureliella helgolandensis TaxID=2527968 RepID=A0A518G6V4_9BACT|nr:LPXTG cell wall anchor domain-containing protein [Aureliella helgolandensis]QDV24311.1 hypothetical protein Q31a_26270 [Aureliella helgolandensis]
MPRPNLLRFPFATALLSALGLALACCSLSRAADIENTTTVGPVTVTARLTPAEPTIGDEIVFEIEVAAEEAVELLMPEFSEALDRYTILDFVPRQKITADGKTLATQRYTLQPIASGPQSIPSILVEFVDNRPGQQPTPEDFDAYEVLTERIDFTVQSVLPSSASSELEPPLGALELQTETSSASLWLYALAGLALLLAGGGLVLWFSKRRRRVKRLTAYEIARTKLQQLISDQQSDQPQFSVEQFFVEISGVVRRYLEDRFELRAPELTTDEFLQLSAAESSLSKAHQSLLSEFLQQADVVKFAGVRATPADVQHSIQLALQFIEETSESTPLNPQIREVAHA